MAAPFNSISNSTNPIKFLYSYGGKILPRPSHGFLRYVGGFTRILSVDPSITYSELMVKFVESCGSSVDLKCKLPNEDIDMLISIKSDEELWNVIEEYNRSAPDAKIRAILFPIKLAKKVSPPSSPMSCLDFPVVRLTTSPPCAAVGFPLSARKHFSDERFSPRYLHQ